MLIKTKNIIFLSIIICFFFNTPLLSQEKEIKFRTLVIDPGHGGKHPGTIRGKTFEKDITLSVALELGKQIKNEHPDVKIIYTRTSDKFVGLSDRAKIANKNNADLFISIHVNSVENKKIHGVETFVMGLDKSGSNMEVCKLENSVITLEDDYSSKYSGFDPNNPESYIIFSLLQNSHLEQSLIYAENAQNRLLKGPINFNRGVKQAAFLVLWKCTMPSVLVELGFLSNDNDYKKLVNKSYQKNMATKLAEAFSDYKSQYEKKIRRTEIKTNNPNLNTNNDNITYKIQIFATTKKLKSNSKSFKGYNCSYIKAGKYYKYTIGDYRTQKEAKKSLTKIKRNFPEAYIIKLEKK